MCVVLTQGLTPLRSPTASGELVAAVTVAFGAADRLDSQTDPGSDAVQERKKKEGTCMRHCNCRSTGEALAV